MLIDPAVEPEQSLADANAPTAEAWHASIGGVPLSRVVVTAEPATLEMAVERSERGQLTEFVNGMLVEKDMGYEESTVGMNIGTELRVASGRGTLGRVSGADGMIRMAGGNGRMPDVSFTHVDDIPPGYRRGAKVSPLPPTIAVEVVSENNTAAEMTAKVAEYFASGSRLVWLVYWEEARIRVHTSPTEHRDLHADNELDAGDVLPDFRVRVADLVRV